MNRDDFRKGVIFGVAAYGMWGLIPIYFKALSGVPALEVLAHRIVWSVVLRAVGPAAWAVARASAGHLRQKDPGDPILTTVLIAFNWYLFIWAVEHDRVLEASLGYYQPVINVPGGGGDVLLVMAGAVTAAPLLCFTSAARLLPLTTLGFLQYLAPSGQFLLAVLAYGEVLTRPHLSPLSVSGLPSRSSRPTRSGGKNWSLGSKNADR